MSGLAHGTFALGVKSRPKPLPPETVLAGRFEIDSVLGQGGFTIGYLARDLRRNDLCAVLELAPEGSARPEDGRPDLNIFGTAHAARLRQMFLDVGRKLGRLNAPSLRGIRAEFCENGTGYVVVEHVPDSRTLGNALSREGPLGHQESLDVLLACLAALEKSHAAGLLHLDLRPSSVLLSSTGKVYLIGFGSTRAWHEESLGLSRSAEDEAYRAPEMANAVVRRGPATDLYGLCAVMYRTVAGAPPPTSAQRAEGHAVVPLRSVRPDLPRSFCEVIEAGLALPYSARPQSVQELRALLAAEIAGESAEHLLEGFDERAVRLMGFRFHKRQCMACGEVLETVRPLRRLACPVCHEGTVRKRQIEPHLCPICRSAPLKHRQNADPLALCPICRTGPLAKVRKKLFSNLFSLRCSECDARFEIEGSRLTLVHALAEGQEEPRKETKSVEDWRAQSGRAGEFWICEGCTAQFDVLADGRLDLRFPERSSRYTALYPGEWAHVAAGLPPYAGNAECDVCGADFDLQNGRLTLLAASQDPFAFADRFLSRPMAIEDACWLGVGKQSPRIGMVCLDCGTEFDEDDGYLRLIQSAHPALVHRIGKELVLEDWHRAAQELPLIGEEKAFEADFDRALVEAYVSGRASLELKKGREVFWKSRARRYALVSGKWTSYGTGPLTVASDGLTFGSLVLKRRIPLDAITAVTLEGDRIVLRLSGTDAPLAFAVPRTTFEARLRSGKRSVPIGANELAARLQWQISAARETNQDAEIPAAIRHRKT